MAEPPRRAELAASTPDQVKEIIEAGQAVAPEFATLLFVAATTGAGAASSADCSGPTST
jgi:hypothetical protein